MKMTRWIVLAVIMLVLLSACGADNTYYNDNYYYNDDYYYEENNESNVAPPDKEAQAPVPTSSYVDITADTPNYRYEFMSSACAFTTTSGRVVCGWLNVPEDRDNPDSSMVQLAVAIIAPENPPGADIPIVYLEGGPGGQALLDVEYLWIDSPLTQNHTVILIDQRGTGYSLPSLNCSELEYGEYDDDFEAAQVCYDRLTAAGVDLTQYNSEDSATDIRDLILALGYEQADLLGVSYGTRLALTVMRDHPEVVRSAILDSVYPPNAYAYTEAPVTTLRTFENLFAGCAADPECNAAYPDLAEVFEILVEELNADPALIEFWEEGYGWYETDFYGDDLVWELLNLMYSTDMMPYLPAFIYAFYDYDYEYAYDILWIADEAILAASPLSEKYYYEDDYLDWEEDISDSEGQYYSVECREEVPFDDYNRAANLTSDYDDDLSYALLSDTDFMIGICDEVWQVGVSDSIERDAVVSDIPTLLLNGTYDPATPAEWARLAAETLSNSQYFEFPGYGHGIIDTGACATDLMLEFLSSPSTRLSGACVNAIPAHPDFVIDP